MANLEVLALDTAVPQIRAPGMGDGYAVPRDMTLSAGTALSAPTVNATTVDTTNVEVTNIKAKDGTAAGSIADSTGVVTLASSVLTTTDINGGTIDGTTVGGSSAAAGTFTTLTASSIATFAAGTAAAPAITTTGDTNTGIWFPAADTIAFTEGGVESMRIDSSANVGLGVTPSPWSSGKAYETAAAGHALWALSNEINVTQNAYFNTGWKYGATAAAARYQQQSGAHYWNIAASGTVNTAITFTAAMTLDASGNLGIGIGNITPSTAAKGINFTANTPTAGMTSQLLNFYEEGTWTPTDASGATLLLTVNSALYVRVGSLVTLFCSVTYPATADVTNSKIGGFPFTSGSIIFGIGSTSGSRGLNMNGAASATSAFILLQNATNITNATLSTLTVVFSATYRV